ncbi:GFA family protein [Sinisalibacter aestuarii]|uniref:CENP-V/GFA domain-containing protein n=1 Tax=Sinisalibacter aestuarii TaxID=2949426 RepID=A0ABQ5LVD2_9RHOB|nr:hypothetical protein [Sinisalibacter aestuarii]GKY88360.1 hypothetical protein STA1M1_22290 [Sinisalibacter aestuarii]
MTDHHASCACGKVQIAFIGAPVAVLSCCCDDCQRAAAALEALPGAPGYTEPCGGSPVALYHRKAMKVISGGDQLEPHKLHPGSPTSRMVARCCNSAMHIGFDKGPFWVTAFLARMGRTAPEPAYRIQTKFLPEPPPGDMPNYPTFPKSLMGRIAWAGLTGLLRRPA